MGREALRIPCLLLGSFQIDRAQHRRKRPGAREIGAVVDEVCRGRHRHVPAVAVLAVERPGRLLLPCPSTHPPSGE